MPQKPETTEIPSPCVGICQISAEGHCVGCFRRLDEIAGWGRLPGGRKQQILDAVARRRKKAMPESEGEHQS